MNDLAPSYAVVVVLNCEDTAQRTVERLSESGFNVIGPVSRAAMGLVLAAQSPVGLAVVGSELGGRRDGRQFAHDLMTAWGAPSILIDADDSDEVWRANGDAPDRIRRILAEADPPPPALA